MPPTLLQTSQLVSNNKSILRENSEASEALGTSLLPVCIIIIKFYDAKIRKKRTHYKEKRQKNDIKTKIFSKVLFHCASFCTLKQYIALYDQNEHKTAIKEKRGETCFRSKKKREEENLIILTYINTNKVTKLRAMVSYI